MVLNSVYLLCLQWDVLFFLVVLCLGSFRSQAFFYSGFIVCEETLPCVREGGSFVCYSFQ